MADRGAASYRRYLDGDDGAFDIILDMYREGLIYFVNRYVHNITEAEDIAADCFAALITEPGKYNFSVSLKTYLYMNGRSRALDRLKHTRRFHIEDIDTAEELADGETTPEELYIADERKRLLYTALDSIKEDYRTAVYLVYLENMSYGEAALVMKKSTKQIENLLYRAKKALREILGNEDAFI